MGKSKSNSKKKKYSRYRLDNRREKNKARRLARLTRNLEKAKQVREEKRAGRRGVKK